MTVPIIVSKQYTGSVQIADIIDNDIYTVEQNNGGTAVGSYDVVLELIDTANYKWTTTEAAAVTLQYEITKAENAWTSTPAINGWTYGEIVNDPTYGAKFGTVKVVYSGTANDGTVYSSETVPTNAGDYMATFMVTDTENYSGLTAEVAFTIAKATYDMSGAKWDYTDAYQYDGLEKTVTVSGLPAGVTVNAYTGNSATVAGDYTAKVTLNYDSVNYNAPVVADLSWSIKNDWNPTEYTVSDANDKGWMNRAFVITAKDGYLVSLTNTADGTWSDTLTGKVSFDVRTGWETFLNAITFGLFYKDEVTVKVDSTDTLSGVADVEYFESDKAMILEEVKAVANWTSYNGAFGVTVEDSKKFIMVYPNMKRAYLMKVSKRSSIS